MADEVKTRHLVGLRYDLVVGEGEEAEYILFVLETAPHAGEEHWVRNCKVSIPVSEALSEGYLTEEALAGMPVNESLPEDYFLPFTFPTYQV